MVPCSAVVGSRDGGVAIRPNTDTPNMAGVLLVDEQGLSGLDIPYPEW